MRSAIRRGPDGPPVFFPSFFAFLALAIIALNSDPYSASISRMMGKQEASESRSATPHIHRTPLAGQGNRLPPGLCDAGRNGKSTHPCRLVSTLQTVPLGALAYPAS